MAHIAYILHYSEALIPEDAQEHLEILRAAVPNNAERHLTGFLHREGPWFIQYLEGAPEDVLCMTGRIARDGRHRRPAILAAGLQPQRLFPDWMMGLSLGRQTLRDYTGHGAHVAIGDVAPGEIVAFLLHLQAETVKLVDLDAEVALRRSRSAAPAPRAADASGVNFTER